MRIDAVVLISSGSPRCTNDCDLPVWPMLIAMAVVTALAWILFRRK